VNQLLLSGSCRGRDHMVVGLTTTHVISAYHHQHFLNLNPAHDDTNLVDKVCLSQMTTDMFHMSRVLAGPFPIHDL
jgi:hypothetical protein